MLTDDDQHITHQQKLNKKKYKKSGYTKLRRKNQAQWFISSDLFFNQLNLYKEPCQICMDPDLSRSG